MKSSDNQFLKFREQQLHHTAHISSFFSKPKREFAQLIHDIFSYKPVVFKSKSPSDARTTILTRHFYNHCYRPNSLMRGVIGNRIDRDDFMNEIFDNSRDEQRNKIFYLLGGVGVGKTCFINWLLSTKIKEHFDHQKLWFVKIDIELLTKGKNLSVAELLKNIVEKSIHIIQDNALSSNPLIENQINVLNIVVGDFTGEIDIRKLADEFVKLCNMIYAATNRRLFLVVDNLDYICHINDKALFKSNDDTQEMPALLSIVELIQNFDRTRLLGKLGANILIITRMDSYNILTQLPQYSLPDTDVALNAYTIIPATWQTVLESRKCLIKYAASLEPQGKEEEFSKMLEIIEEHLNSSKGNDALSENLMKLSNRGLRDVIDYFAEYAWIPKEQEIYKDGLIKRFVHHWPVGMMVFLLNQRCLFSQETSKFPNIFLNNIQSQNENDDEIANETDHSYWLSFLILLSLGKEINYSTQALLAIFCGNDNDGYPIELVKQNLGILSDLVECNAILVERELNDSRTALRVKKICLSERGHHFIKNVYSRFYYLQLVVDDNKLPLPRCISSDFEYDGQHYGYATESESEYLNKAKKMIAMKAKRVMLFTYVLEHSLSFETMKYSSVFQKLQEVKKVVLPDINMMREQISEELNALNKRLNSFCDVSKICSYARSKGPLIQKELGDLYMPKKG